VTYRNVQRVLVAMLQERVATFFLDAEGYEIPIDLRNEYENERYIALATLWQRIESAKSLSDLDAVCRDLLAFDNL